MIIFIKEEIEEKKLIDLAADFYGVIAHYNGQKLLILSGKIKVLPEKLKNITDHFIITDSDIQLAEKINFPEKKAIKIGNIVIGGHHKNTVIMAGPCSVESKDQIEKVSQYLVKKNIKFLRAGSYKPRTSPYSFQGLGEDGLKILAEMRLKYGLKIITEVRDATHVDKVIEYTDIIQIGAKAMYDHGILRASGTSGKPVLIKRGFGTTLQEFVQSAEFVLSAGNPEVMLCERGIRTFETKTRFTLDLCGVAWLKEKTNLPVIVDPSHAMGWAFGVPDLTRASAAMDIDGLLIEIHPEPSSALSDASQQLNFQEFDQLFDSLQPIVNAIGKTLI